MSARTKITITKDDLGKAMERLAWDPQLSPALWTELDTVAPKARFNAANVAFYFGAMVIIAAMTCFLTLAWDQTSGIFKTSAALIYAAVFSGSAYLLSRREGARVPSGLLATVAVCMTPLAVYGIEQARGVWNAAAPDTYHNFYEYVSGSWIFMELATIVAGIVAIRLVRFPFLIAPIAFAGWFASMDLAPLVFHTQDWSLAWDDRAAVSTAVGVIMIAAAFAIDRFTREDYAFWMYLFGSLSFWSGVWMRLDDVGELEQFGSFALGIAFIAAGVVLGRRVLAVFGCLGCFGYVGHLAWINKDSLSFPVALTIGGLAVIGLGLLYQAVLPKLEAALQSSIPANVRALIPESRV